MTAEVTSSMYRLNNSLMLKKLEFLIVGLITGLIFFFTPYLSSHELSLPWAERLSTIFKFASGNLWLVILTMSGVYIVAGAIPFGAYCLLRKKSNHFFFSFLFFSLGLLISYIILLFVIFSTFNPTVL